jgi:hypothetical protein
MAPLGRLLASFIVVTIVCWIALLALPTWFMTAVLGVCLVIAVVGGFIRLVLITLTPPRG